MRRLLKGKNRSGERGCFDGRGGGQVGDRFADRVYAVVANVPRGRVVTYGEVARLCGATGAARAVGNAMNKNPYAPKVPCHRVIKSSGEIGGFASGTKNKIKLLKKEGIEIKNDKIDLNQYLYTFSHRK